MASAMARSASSGSRSSERRRSTWFRSADGWRSLRTECGCAWTDNSVSESRSDAVMSHGLAGSSSRKDQVGD